MPKIAILVYIKIVQNYIIHYIIIFGSSQFLKISSTFEINSQNCNMKFTGTTVLAKCNKSWEFHMVVLRLYYKSSENFQKLRRSKTYICIEAVYDIQTTMQYGTDLRTM